MNLAREIHISHHAVKRFRWRCSEGSPWPEFTSGDIKAWMRTMVADNARKARYYRHVRGYKTIAVPLVDEGCLLAVAVCDRSLYPPSVVAVKTVYGPKETGWNQRLEGFLPRWWENWCVDLKRAGVA